MAGFENCERPPIRIVTRLLAEMQTAILSVGVNALGGDLNRFVIFTLISRQTFDGNASISTASLAASLNRPYETVRRHANGLVAAGLCERRRDGFAVVGSALHHPNMAQLIVTAHDSFVRLVDDLARHGIPMPEPRSIEIYRPQVGLQAVADIMLAVADNNQGTHEDWVDLVIYSTIFCANVGRAARDPDFVRTYRDETRLVLADAYDPIRPSRIAHVTGISDTTVRRRVAAMLADGRILGSRKGVIVSDAWLNRPLSVATSTSSYYGVRRILQRVALGGFPFANPSAAYLAGRPADMRFTRSPSRTDGTRSR